MRPYLNLLWLTILTGSILECRSQIIDIKKTTENVFTNQTNQAINNGINRGVNAIFNAPGKIYQKIKDKQQQPANIPTTNRQSNTTNTSTTNNYNTPTPEVTVADLKTIYGTDFTPGSTVLWTENFSTSSA